MVSQTGQMRSSTVTDAMMTDRERARLLLKSIDWTHVRFERVAGGSVNQTFRLHDGRERWYLRIGPTIEDCANGPGWFTSRGLQREMRAIALWSDHANLLPRTVHSDFSRSLVPADWVIQKEIPGEPWEAMRAKLTKEETRSLWRQLGELTAQLHAYVGQDFGPPEPGVGTQRWSEMIRWDATGLLVDAQRYQLPTMPFVSLCSLVDRSVHELDEITRPRLIHSDLGLRHVLVRRNEANEPVISGLIDLEFARFADAYSETLFVAQALEPQRDPMFDIFLDAYGAGRPDRNARLRSLIYQMIAMAWWATDAMRRNRPAEAREVLNAMERRVDEDKLLG